MRPQAGSSTTLLVCHACLSVLPRVLVDVRVQLPARGRILPLGRVRAARQPAQRIRDSGTRGSGVCTAPPELVVGQPLRHLPRTLQGAAALRETERGHGVTPGRPSPCPVQATFSSCAPEFAGYEQHDASEFLSAFVDRLSEDLNQARGGKEGGGREGGGLLAAECKHEANASPLEPCTEPHTPIAESARGEVEPP